MAKSHLPSPSPGSVRILTLRGRRIILDQDLAELYAVPTKRLNQQVRRNAGRFPVDFAFQLTASEWQELRSQNATSSWGGRRSAPFAFTEHGTVMAAAVLNSRRAIDTSIYVVRAFVSMRDALANARELSSRLDDLEKRLDQRLQKHDDDIAEILRAIRALMVPPDAKRRPIGFIDPD